jgi:hypothetical protein
VRFLAESLYLDDRPGSPMRFQVEPNLNQLIRRQKEEIDASDVRAELHERIRQLFGAAGGALNLVPFPAGPYEVPDEVGDGRPFLVVLGYEALVISPDPRGLPHEIDANPGVPQAVPTRLEPYGALPGGPETAFGQTGGGGIAR